MFDPEGELNPFFELVRATKHLVKVLLENGWSIEQARTFALERASQVIPDDVPDDDNPAFALVRSILARSVDEAIYLNHPEMIEVGA